MTPCYKKFAFLWLVNHQEDKATCHYQGEIQMVIQLGFIQRFAIFVRKEMFHIEGRN